MYKYETIYKADYYPFGWVMSERELVAANKYRFGYQGQFAENDDETGWNFFEFRYYNGKIGRWMSPDLAHQHYSPYLAMSNNPAYIDINGLTDWNGVFSASLGIIGGASEIALGVGVTGGSGGLATAGGALLMIDGGVRVGSNYVKLVHAFSDNTAMNNQGNKIPTNIGGYIGLGIDMNRAENKGIKITFQNNDSKYKHALGLTNDFATIAFTGGSGMNYQAWTSNTASFLQKAFATTLQINLVNDVVQGVISSPNVTVGEPVVTQFGDTIYPYNLPAGPYTYNSSVGPVMEDGTF